MTSTLRRILTWPNSPTDDTGTPPNTSSGRRPSGRTQPSGIVARRLAGATPLQNSRPGEGADALADEAFDRADDTRDLHARWTGGSHLATRATSVALLITIVCGPIALALVGLAYLSVSGTAAPFVAAAPDRSSEQAAAGEFASQTVVAWLEATNDPDNPAAATLARNLGSASTVLPDTGQLATQPDVAAITRTASGLWSVTVAVTVTNPAATATATAPVAAATTSAPTPTRQYFQIPVSFQAGALVAVALPAPVAGPAEAAPPQLAYRHQVDPGSPVAASAAGFLTALLTGSSDATRFESPGTVIAPLQSAPYTAVTLGAVTATGDLTGTSETPTGGEQVQLLITARAQLADGQQLPVQYALTMAARAGRWEVRSLDPAPALQPVTDGAASPTSSSGAGAPSSAPSTPTPTGAASTPTGS